MSSETRESGETPVESMETASPPAEQTAPGGSKYDEAGASESQSTIEDAARDTTDTAPAGAGDSADSSDSATAPDATAQEGVGESTDTAPDTGDAPHQATAPEYAPEYAPSAGSKFDAASSLTQETAGPTEADQARPQEVTADNNDGTNENDAGINALGRETVTHEESTRLTTEAAEPNTDVTAPETAQHVANYVETHDGAPPPEHIGGRTYENDGRSGGEVLPQTDTNGNPVTYKEYDIHPYERGVNRGAERAVQGSDGSWWYTNDHYTTFRRFSR